LAYGWFFGVKPPARRAWTGQRQGEAAAVFCEGTGRRRAHADRGGHAQPATRVPLCRRL